jgi:hypothetical protein
LNAPEAALEERKGMALGGVPEPYLDAWARLQIQKNGSFGWGMAASGRRRWQIP